MIAIGKFQKFKILRQTSPGFYLGDEEGNEVLLPNKYCPEHFTQDAEIEVFIYRDHEDRKIATTLTPAIRLNEFGFLKVAAVGPVGAFLDWGLEKELLVPFKEQRLPMEEGRWYVVYLALDEKTDRLYASNKIDNYLQNEHLTVQEGSPVDLLIYQKTDLGFSVIINHLHKGVIYHNEIFREIRIGDRMKGYIKKIREDQKIDVTLQPEGYLQTIDPNCTMIMDHLKESDGILFISDKSSSKEIQDIFGISKKAFKKALGALYKEKKIGIEPSHIFLANPEGESGE